MAVVEEVVLLNLDRGRSGGRRLNRRDNGAAGNLCHRAGSGSHSLESSREDHIKDSVDLLDQIALDERRAQSTSRECCGEYGGRTHVDDVS